VTLATMEISPNRSSPHAGTPHADTKQAIGEMYDEATVTAEDIAEVISFALARPRHLAINEILLRPADQL
jgi:NADP-dependent 3-hydroxy acid dehydrogenase YdfG